MSNHQMTAQGSTTPTLRCLTPRSRVRAVSKGLFAQTLITAHAIVSLVFNMKPLTWLATDRGAR